MTIAEYIGEMYIDICPGLLGLLKSMYPEYFDRELYFTAEVSNYNSSRIIIRTREFYMIMLIEDEVTFKVMVVENKSRLKIYFRDLYNYSIEKDGLLQYFKNGVYYCNDERLSSMTRV